MNEVNRRLTPDGNIEQDFRAQVRDLLDLDIFTRDFAIFEEIKRLKRVDQLRTKAIKEAIEDANKANRDATKAIEDAAHRG